MDLSGIQIRDLVKTLTEIFIRTMFGGNTYTYGMESVSKCLTMSRFVGSSQQYFTKALPQQYTGHEKLS